MEHVERRTSNVERRRRVVVTGIGAITPIGATISEMWESLVAGRSGVDYIKRIDASTFPTTFGAEVRDFDEAQTKALYAWSDRVWKELGKGT